MELKAHMYNNICVLIFSLLIGCGKNDAINSSTKIIFEKVDVSQIPDIVVFKNDSALKLQNGVYYFGDKPFSGLIKEQYDIDAIKSIGSYLSGKQHGITKTFFLNGKLDSKRSFKNGKAYGTHIGFWENGNKKFEFNYYNNKREGLQKQWYESGSQYCELIYTNDTENGMQKAWRENGKPYINYEVKDGLRYGLQKSGLCYTLKNDTIK